MKMINEVMEETSTAFQCRVYFELFISGALLVLPCVLGAECFQKSSDTITANQKKKQAKFSSDRTGPVFAPGVWCVLQKDPLLFSAGNLDQNIG